MDSRKSCLLLLLLIVKLMVWMDCVLGKNLVFEVHHKYCGGRGGKAKAALRELRAHDMGRHGRMLAAVDFELGGDSSPTRGGLFYTKVTIGTPPVDYHVQVDTGSDILWLNCQNCERCPTKSTLKIPLRRYDMTASSTAQKVTCDQEFCDTSLDDPIPGCKIGMSCEYTVTYGDGTETHGYFVRDYFMFDQVTGDLHTSTMNGSVFFGCSDKQSGELGSSTEAVDGIIGFGSANTSILSQLAASGKVKKVFSHCLNSDNGGGIFAIGEVIDPSVKRTPLVPNKSHYNVFLEAIEVGGEFLNLPTDESVTGSSRGAIIDSGTTLAYLPSEVYLQLINKITQKQPNLKIYTTESQFQCFRYHGNVDDEFPVVVFHVRDSLTLSVHPREYLFPLRAKEYCIGWQNSAQNMKNGLEVTLLGDIVLSDKLVLYDLENQTIGWTQYNCSSSIKVRDEETGNAYDVAAHISCAFCLFKVNVIMSLVFIIAAARVTII